MSLTRSLDVARSHLSATSEYMQTVSRNVARANDPSAVRKVANLVTTAGGGVRIGSITRAGDELLAHKALVSTSGVARNKAVIDALDRLNDVVGDPELETSPAMRLQQFQSSLQAYSEAPHDDARGRAALLSARDLVAGLNSAANQTQVVRQQADTAIADTVAKVNDLLARFEQVNNEVMRGTISGRDVTDSLDQRDQIVTQLAESFGIRTEIRDNNDMALRTDGGVTVFDRVPRKLSFQTSGSFNAGTVGNAIYVDGVAITGPQSIMPISSGALAGLIYVRDEATVKFQTQLDEIARGLIESFAEEVQPGGGTPRTGLFTYSGGPAVPTTGVAVTGLAAALQLSAAVDPQQGGNVKLLRDGGINGASYVYNSTSASGYNTRLLALGEAMSTARSFDTSAGLQASSGLLQFSADVDGWLSAARSTAQDDYEYTSVVYERSVEALNKVTGVNVQEEFLVMLELERSYQASSKLLTTINSMFDSLLSAVR